MFPPLVGTVQDPTPVITLLYYFSSDMFPLLVGTVQDPTPVITLLFYFSGDMFPPLVGTVQDPTPEFNLESDISTRRHNLHLIQEHKPIFEHLKITPPPPPPYSQK